MKKSVENMNYGKKKNLVEKKRLQYFLNQFVYVYDHLIDDCHHFLNEKLEEIELVLRRRNSYILPSCSA